MEKILDLYRKKHDLYNDFTHEMQELITNLLMGKNIRIHSIVSRTKEENSLKNKIDQKKYTQLEEITDLCGVRIITYFSDDVDQIADIIQESLAIDPANSVDKRKLLSPTQFGYLSLHLVAGLKPDQLQLPYYQKFKNCKVEIQICSILQHAWAEIEHDLEYKSKTTISYNTRRSFSRLAGLLEIADTEFVKLREHLQPSVASTSVKEPAALPFMSDVRISTAISFKDRLLLKVSTILTYFSAIRVKHTDATTLEIGSAYTLLGMILALVITHILNIPHLFSAIVASLHTEKNLLFSLASYPSLVMGI